MLSNPYVILKYTGYMSFFLEIFIIQMLFMRKFPHRKHFVLRLLGSIALSAGLIFIPAINIGIINITFLIVLAYSILVSIICFRIDLLNACFFGLTAWAAQHFAWSIILIVCMSVKMSVAWTLVAYVGVYTLSYAAIFFTCSFRRGEYMICREKLVTVAVFALILLITIFIYDFASYYDRNTVWYSVYAAVSCILVLFTQFGISAREGLLSQRERLETEKETLESLLFRQAKQRKLTDETIEIINRKCHDLKHQIALLRRMSHEESEKTLSEIERAVLIYDDIAKTGNYALDITLMEKCLLCEEYHIRFTYIVNGEKLGVMEAVDVSSLFGNILDNAIENSLKENENHRIIRLNVAVWQGFLRIHCENYCSRQVEFKDGLPVSERRESGYHGFGAKSIRYIAAKYGGNLAMSLEDNVFSVNIIIPLADSAVKIA